MNFWLSELLHNKKNESIFSGLHFCLYLNRKPEHLYHLASCFILFWDKMIRNVYFTLTHICVQTFKFPNWIVQLFKNKASKVSLFLMSNNFIAGCSCLKMHKERNKNFLLLSFRSLQVGPLPLMELGSDAYKIQLSFATWVFGSKTSKT